MLIWRGYKRGKLVTEIESEWFERKGGLLLAYGVSRG